MKDKPNLSILLILLLIGFPQLSETIYSPALPSMSDWFQVDPHLIEMSLMTYFLGFAAGVGIWGRMADIWGRRPVMLVGLVIYVISCICLRESGSISSLLAWRGVQGFGASVGSVITQTMVRDTLDGKERNRVFSLIAVSIGFVPAIGPWLGSILTAHFSWEANFTFLTLFGVALFGMCAFRLPETLPNRKVKAAPIGDVALRMVRDTRVWGHVLLVAATNGILFGFYAEGPFLFMENFGFATESFGYLGLMISASTLLAATLSFKLQGRLQPEDFIRTGSMLTLLVSIVLLALIKGSFFWAGMGAAKMGGLLLLLGVLFFAISLIIPNSLSIALVAYRDVLGTAGALFGTAYYLGLSALMWTVGALHDGSTSPLFIYYVTAALFVQAGRYLTQRPGCEIVKL